MSRTLYTGLNAIEAPAHLRRAIAMRGGLNPYGEPMYRLVRAEGRKRLSMGKWYDWAPGTATVDKKPELNRALRSVIEARPIAVYPGEHGWVLEKWMPASHYGTSEGWYLPQEMGGTVRTIDGVACAAHGDYPSRGDYEGTSYIFPNEALSEALVLHAIGRIEHLLDGLPQNPATRMRMSIAKAEEEDRKKQAEADQLCHDMLEDDNIFDRRTPGARAEINKLAESIGIRSEVY